MPVQLASKISYDRNVTNKDCLKHPSLTNLERYLWDDGSADTNVKRQFGKVLATVLTKHYQLLTITLHL